MAQERGDRSPALERPATLDRELGFRMGQTHRVLKEAWERRIADLGMSAPPAAMLSAVCEQPGSGLRELARRMRTDPMNAKRLIDHLEHEGLVTSSGAAAHAQRRAIEPTAAGLERAARLVERSTAFRRRLAELVGAGELERLQRLLARLDDALVVEAEVVTHGEPAAAGSANPAPTGPTQGGRA